MKHQVIYKWHVHHIIPVSRGGAEWDLNNLELLCTGCHKIVHAKQEGNKQ